MAYLDSADIVRRALLRLGRPATDEAFTVSVANDVLYDFATEGQDRITKQLGVHVPDALWTVPTALTTADAGKTYGFGNDVDAAAIFAFGHFYVYEQRADIPDTPLTEGIDFTVEGTKLRIPNNAARTFADSGPWAQYVAPSNVIASGTQPTIPKFARLALVAEVARAGAERLGVDSSPHEAQYQKDFLDILAAIKTQSYLKGGATLFLRPRSAWPYRRGRF
jgi:hypothetical protein